MRITDIIKKLSHPSSPSSQTFSSKVNNNIKTQETAPSSSAETADVHETKETAPLETIPVAEAKKIQQAPEVVITTPLSEEVMRRQWVWGVYPEDVITTPLSEETAPSSSDETAVMNETKETAPLETVPVEEAEKIQQARECLCPVCGRSRVLVEEAEKIQQAPEDVITIPLFEETASPSSDATADVNATKETALLKTVPVEKAEKIQQAPEDVITTPLFEETASSSPDATADVNETKETAPLKTVPAEEGGRLYKKFSGQVRGDGIDNDAWFSQMWKAVNEFLLNASENRKADPSAVMSTAETIINSLRKNNDLVKVLFAKKQSNDITSHLIDTAIVAAKIGFALGYSSDQMRELVICALVHDIGMLRVQEEIRLKKNGLSETEWTEIRKHPGYSFEILKNKGLPPIVSEVAYQEQEREDGSGYPQGLKGESIHEYAKIIGLSAIYTAMLQPRPQRERKIPFEIIKELIERHKEQFPMHLVRIMIEEFAVFPVGLYVKLNTGEIARVVLTNRLAPMKPTIEVLIDSHGRRLQEPKKYDMTKETILQIVDTSFEIE